MSPDSTPRIYITAAMSFAGQCLRKCSGYQARTLDLWLSASELHKILTLLADRSERSGSAGHLITYVDGLTGLPDATTVAYPQLLDSQVDF